MIISTLDPITLNDVTDLENSPYVIEGNDLLKIYFESEENRQKYMNNMIIHGSADTSGLKNICDDLTDNPNTGPSNQVAGNNQT